MNRKPKFRAWDNYLKLLGEVNFMYDTGSDTWEVDYEGNPGEPKTGLVLDQFTGLTDSEGKEIYEGDIVEFTYWWFDGRGEAETTLNGEVVYLPECLSFGLMGVKNKLWCKHVGCDPEVGDTCAFAFWRFEEADFHVIGNVHQSQELLK